MFTIIGLMLTGMLAGYLLRNKDLSRIQALITLLIWVLLFILGIEVGSNDDIISGLHTIGLEALLLTLGGTLGSVIAAWALWRKLSPCSLSPSPSPVGRGEVDDTFNEKDK